MSILNFGQVRDHVSNLGFKENDKFYVFGANCLDALEGIENELLNEDVLDRRAHIGLHNCGAVKKNLIPILQHGKNNKVIATATRILVQLTLSVDCLVPVEDALTTRTQNFRKRLLLASYETKKAFLDNSSTFPIVEMLREAMIKSEKHNVVLNEDDCSHLKNCLMLLQNILHLPEESAFIDKMSCGLENWHHLQNKLIWNLFVQGVDGALLLMLNSKYRVHWTVPLIHIIAILYKNQNLTKVYEALEMISSASDTSCDEEESYGSKNSICLSSEPGKRRESHSDSGCASATDVDEDLVHKEVKFKNTSLHDCNNFDIHKKLEKVRITDNPEHENNLKNSNGKDPVRSSCPASPHHKKIKGSTSLDEQEASMSEGTSSKDNSGLVEIMDYSSSDILGKSSDEDVSDKKSIKNFKTDQKLRSCLASPHHKKVKGSTLLDEQEASMSEGTSSKDDSGLVEIMDCSSSDILGKSSDEDISDKKSIKNFKAVQKLRSLQIQTKVSESDSSNEDMQNIKVKYRSHPPTGRRGKSPRRNNGCTPFVCMDSAIATSLIKGKLKYPLLERRKSITNLVDAYSAAPSDEDIGKLIKEFTICFMHCGFSYLVQDLKNLVLVGEAVGLDKSLLFWLISYFLQLASSVHLNINHLSDILSIDVISYLVFECVLSCESFDLNLEGNEKIQNYLIDQLKLIVTALKETMLTIDLYSKKSNLQKERTFFFDLYGKLAELQHLQQIPLLLMHYCSEVDCKDFTEDVIILNHYILSLTEKVMDTCSGSMKSNLIQKLKHYSTKTVISSYALLLEDYNHNSNILNESLFTMMHHIAGDVRASECLFVPSILKCFSSLMNEDNELEPYQEDLMAYILNKFKSEEKKKQKLKTKNKDDDSSSTASSCHNSDFMLSDDEDLFWWYLQYEQDRDPITRISEHVSISKRDASRINMISKNLKYFIIIFFLQKLFILHMHYQLLYLIDFSNFIISYMQVASALSEQS